MATRSSDAARHAPIEGETSAEAVARHVRRLIFEGKLEAGQRLPQDDIAAAVGVSRIPVREAIIALEREGWLHVVPHRGAFVNPFDEQAVNDRFTLYSRFYGFAVRRALARMTPDDLQLLHDCAADVERATAAPAFERANTHYLSTLVRLAGSNRLRAVLRSTVQIVPGNFFRSVPDSIPVQKAGIAAVQRALEAGDAEAAERAFAETEALHARGVVSMIAAHRSTKAR